MPRALAFFLSTALFAQTAPDPSDILSRARFQIASLTRRLPKYACVETIDREYFQRPHVRDCDQAAADDKRGRTKLALQVTDRVRINVAQGDGQEVHSWPGATRFDTEDIDQLITRGPASTGGFGGYLVDIFDNEGAEFSFLGAKNEAGRQMFTYGYRVDEASHYRVRTDGGWVGAAFEGSFDIDTATLELVRLTVDAPVLPRETGLCEAHSSAEFTRARIGNGEYLLPRENELRLTYLGTLATNSTSVFAGCHEYRAEPEQAPVESRRVNARLVLPAGADLRVHLDSAIDSDVAAAGDRVSATVTEVFHPAISNPLALRGAVVSGRIMRMEHWLMPKRQFVVAIHWDSISQGGDSSPLTAVLRNPPVWIACMGKAVLPGYVTPDRPIQPAMIDGRMQPRLPDFREVLPLSPTDAGRCVVPQGQELVLTVPEGAAAR